MRDSIDSSRFESAEVLYTTEPLTIVSRSWIESLKAAAARNPRKRIRLCSHPAAGDRLHEMLIVHERSAYVRPHRHPGKSESTHVIEGEVDVVFFDDAGDVTRVVSLGDYHSGSPFYYRLDAALFHTLLIRSDVLVFHETTNGPFDRADTVFPNWAPDGKDENAAAEYVAKLKKCVDKFK